MMIGSGPAAICRPPPFLTELLSSFSLQLLQCAYALIVQHFLHHNVKPWEDVPFWLAEGCSLIFNNTGPPCWEKKKKKEKTERKTEKSHRGCKFNLCAQGGERTSWIKVCLRSAVKVFIFLFKSQPTRRYLCDDDDNDDVQIKRQTLFFFPFFSFLVTCKKKRTHKNKTTLSPIFECWIYSLRRPGTGRRLGEKKKTWANVKERLNKQTAIRTITLPIFADCNLKIFACCCLRKKPPHLPAAQTPFAEEILRDVVREVQDSLCFIKGPLTWIRLVSRSSLIGRLDTWHLSHEILRNSGPSFRSESDEILRAANNQPPILPG